MQAEGVFAMHGKKQGVRFPFWAKCSPRLLVRNCHFGLGLGYSSLASK